VLVIVVAFAIAALGLQLSEVQDTVNRTELLMVQPLPTVRRVTTQDYVIIHDETEGVLKLACAALVLPYEHQGPIDGEMLPNRTMQFDCEFKSKGDTDRLQTTDPYYEAIEAEADADQT